MNGIYWIRFISLPHRVFGVTVEDRDGFYNIYINDRLCYDAQTKAIIHELRHVFGNDFDPSKALAEIENYRPQFGA